MTTGGSRADQPILGYEAAVDALFARCWIHTGDGEIWETLEKGRTLVARAWGEGNADLVASAPALQTENDRLRQESRELVEALEHAVSILGSTGTYKPHYDTFLMEARATIQRGKAKWEKQ